MKKFTILGRIYRDPEFKTTFIKKLKKIKYAERNSKKFDSMR